MAVYIAHTAADIGVAKSLATFLKGQSLPVRLVGVERLSQAVRQADNLILLWSRDMASKFGQIRNRQINPAFGGRTIYVDLDGAAALPESTDAIDARSSGLRQGRAWRHVAAAAKGRDTLMSIIAETSAPAKPKSTKGRKVVSSRTASDAKPKTQFLSAYGFGALVLIAMCAALFGLAPEFFAKLGL